ncbi:hypothetical protein HYH02_005313 [Chlamydomonas schloesseri]|uniref:Uncharacterized protein n=1 Tax=Chlamydomonas schloesseri TaxID=2026947 RepID=A0A835WL89_9CHLO|nr:hypothetical protein HYH02_005313 [Chlamydomonas schloesseri]|eukprot:KAG2449789.1 hypothetical protein HYH02_005313 [Chlamydomonas schloesseri]
MIKTGMSSLLGRPSAQAGRNAFRSAAARTAGGIRRAGAGPRLQTAREEEPAPAATPSGWVSFFATCHPGLEQVVANELMSLGYRGVEPGKAGVSFVARRLSDGYAANLHLRSAIRVMALLAEGQLGVDPAAGRRGGQALYDMVYEAAPWHDLIPRGASFSVEPRLWSCTDLSSTQLVWSRVKDAVCDSIRQQRPDKPTPPEKGRVADVPLYVTCYKDTVKVYRDMSGESLHRRGYRDVMHRAALNEAAAAGVLALSGWPQALEEAGDGEGLVLADPMCGSGTLLIEAALMARDIAPGLMRSLQMPSAAPPSASTAARASGGGSGGGSRRDAPLAEDAWPFQRWGDYDATAWAEQVEAAKARVRPPWRGRLIGIDVHEGAIGLAERQARKAGVYNMLELQLADCGTVELPEPPTHVVCNPPWGARLDGSSSGSSSSGGSSRASRVWSEGRDDWGEGGDEEGEAAAAGAGEEEFGGGAGGRGHSGRYERGGPVAQPSEREEAFLAAAWKSLDGFLYRQCPGASAAVISGNPEPYKYLKLKPKSKHRLVLSGVDVQVAEYKIRDLASRAAASAAAAAGGPGSATSQAPGRRDRRSAAVPDGSSDAPESPAKPSFSAAREEAEQGPQEVAPRRVLAPRGGSHGQQEDAGRRAVAPPASRPAPSAPAAGAAAPAVGAGSTRVRAVEPRKAVVGAPAAAAPVESDAGPPAVKVPDAYADDGYWES